MAKSHATQTPPDLAGAILDDADLTCVILSDAIPAGADLNPEPRHADRREPDRCVFGGREPDRRHTHRCKPASGIAVLDHAQPADN